MLDTLQKLYKDTEINFKIETLWDGPITVYFGFAHTISGFSFKDMQSVETMEDAVKWLIKKYQEINDE